VTGGNVSNIFGTIQTTGFGNSNLFLMNPAGFLFGPNATVNVGGMVSFSSSDYLRLTDGLRFNAVPNSSADALLSAAPVAAFGFLGKNHGAITMQGSQLTVAGPTVQFPESGDASGLAYVNGVLRQSANLSLIGGDITVQGGTLTAPGGHVTLVSVGKPSNAKVGGEVSLAGTPTGFSTMGTVTLSQGTAINVGNSLFAPNAAVGSVVIRGGQVMLNSATVLTGNTMATTETPSVTIESRGSIDMRNSSLAIETETGHVGAIDLTAGKNITVTDSPLTAHGIYNATGGSLTLTAPTISVSGSTFIAGHDASGGTISLNATKGVILANTDLIAISYFGRGGTILINGGNLVDAQQTTMEAWGAQTGGTIQVRANKIALTDTQLLAWALYGQAGLITLDAKSTTLTNSRLQATHGSSTFEGEGGTIVIASPKFKQTGSVLDVSSGGGPNGTVIINGIVQP